jgi:hypothetical protein
MGRRLKENGAGSKLERRLISGSGPTEIGAVAFTAGALRFFGFVVAFQIRLVRTRRSLSHA